MSIDTVNSLDSQWKKISGLLRAEFGEAAYRSWLKPMSVHGRQEGMVTLAVPTRFMRDWVIAHYADRMSALWESEDPNVSGVDVVVKRNGMLPCVAVATPNCSSTSSSRFSTPTTRGTSAPEDPASSHVPATANGLAKVNGSAGATKGSDFGAPLDLRLTFDNFVVGKPNEFAYAAARRVADAPKVAFNPLFLYGGVGLGKPT